MKRNSDTPTPGANAQIALKRPIVAGFLVGINRRKTPAHQQGTEYLNRVASLYDQSLPEALQGLMKIDQSLGDEILLARAGIGLFPVFRLDHVDRQHRPLSTGL